MVSAQGCSKTQILFVLIALINSINHFESIAQNKLNRSNMSWTRSDKIPKTAFAYLLSSQKCFHNYTPALLLDMRLILSSASSIELKRQSQSYHPNTDSQKTVLVCYIE